MTRKEFEQYLRDLNLNPKLEKKYWIIYKKINVKRITINNIVLENKLLDLFLDLSLASSQSLDLSNTLLDSRCLE